MATFTGTAETDQGACVRCDTELEETDAYVCDVCREQQVGLDTKAGPCKEISIERSGVTLTKSIGRRDGEPVLRYALSSSRTEQVSFELEDMLPTSVSQDVLSQTDSTPPEKSVDISWWIPANGECHFTRPLPSRERDPEHATEHTVEFVPKLDVESPQGIVAGRGSPRTNGETPNDPPGETLSQYSGRTVVALPAYNEAASIADVVTKAKRHADAVLVVDDGSSDDTCHHAWNAGAVVQRHQSNRGYGATLQTIFEKAEEVNADHLVVLDGDGQHDPDDVPKLINAQTETGAEIVIGNRYAAKDDTSIPLYRRGGLAVINFLTNFSLGSIRGDNRISDTQSGFRAYDRRAISSLAEANIGDQMGVSYDILYQAHQRGFDIEEVGTAVSYDGENNSSHNPIRHGLMVISNLIPSLERERPLITLGLPGFLFTAVGLGMGAFLLGQVSEWGILAGVGLFAALLVTQFGFFACMTGALIYALHRYHDLAPS